jgi:hypothetical protein
MSIREHFLIDEKGPIGYVIMTPEERMDLAKKYAILPLLWCDCYIFRSQTGDCHCGYSANDMLNNKSHC